MDSKMPDSECNTDTQEDGFVFSFFDEAGTLCFSSGEGSASAMTNKVITITHSHDVEYLRHEAELGESSAQFRLGVMYDIGYIVSKDIMQAAYWFRKLVLHEDMRAYCYIKLVHNENYTEISESDAQYHLGHMYHACMRNAFPGNLCTSPAIYWLRKAADQGHIEAQYELGNLYISGFMVKNDYNQAVPLIKKAAEQGFAQAQNHLGTMYLFGNGVMKNADLALEWLNKAADQGNGFARRNLGLMKRGEHLLDYTARKWPGFLA